MAAQTADVVKSTTSMSLKLATMVVTTLPIGCVYPFLQKYFVKGMKMCIRDRLMVSAPAKAERKSAHPKLKGLWKQRYLQLMVIPGIIWMFIFNYIPKMCIRDRFHTILFSCLPTSYAGQRKA